jgi:hypothetical protein
MSGKARFAGILRQAVSLFRWGSAVIAESSGKDVTKIKYPRLKLRPRSLFDTPNMKKWYRYSMDHIIMSVRATIILPGTIGGPTVTRTIDVRIGATDIGHIITGATIELLALEMNC